MTYFRLVNPHRTLTFAPAAFLLMIIGTLTGAKEVIMLRGSVEGCHRPVYCRPSDEAGFASLSFSCRT